MNLGKTLYAKDRGEWRRWLKANFRKEGEIWLVFYKKGSGKPRIPYNDAVEEALCFGWIDSIAKRLDGRRFCQRFSLRNPGSGYSEINKARLRRMAEEGKVVKPVLEAAKGILREKYEYPEDILRAIRANPAAWRNFRGFSEPYRRIRVAFIDASRARPEEFRKRLGYFVEMTAKGKMFGFGGVEKYY